MFALRLCSLLFVLALSACQQVPVEPNGIDANDNPEAADYNVQAGVGYIRQQQFQRALVKFEKALQQNPSLIEAGLGKAAALQGLQRMQLAEELYLSLIKQNPKRHEPATAYAGLLCQQQRFEQAEAVMLSALKEKAFLSGDEAYLRLSRCALRGERVDLAELYLQRAQEYAEGDTASSKEIALQQAWLSYTQKQYSVAQTWLETFERHSPLRADAVRLGYQIASAQNNAERMATYGQILRQTYPQIWSQLNTVSQ